MFLFILCLLLTASVSVKSMDLDRAQEVISNSATSSTLAAQSSSDVPLTQAVNRYLDLPTNLHALIDAETEHDDEKNNAIVEQIKKIALIDGHSVDELIPDHSIPARPLLWTPLLYAILHGKIRSATVLFLLGAGTEQARQFLARLEQNALHDWLNSSKNAAMLDLIHTNTDTSIRNQMLQEMLAKYNARKQAIKQREKQEMIKMEERYALPDSLNYLLLLEDSSNPEKTAAVLHKISRLLHSKPSQLNRIFTLALLNQKVKTTALLLRLGARIAQSQNVIDIILNNFELEEICAPYYSLPKTLHELASVEDCENPVRTALALSRIKHLVLVDGQPVDSNYIIDDTEEKSTHKKSSIDEQKSEGEDTNNGNGSNNDKQTSPTPQSMERLAVCQRTPLFFAVACNKELTVRLLLELGASKDFAKPELLLSNLEKPQYSEVKKLLESHIPITIVKQLQQQYLSKKGAYYLEKYTIKDAIALRDIWLLKTLIKLGHIPCEDDILECILSARPAHYETCAEQALSTNQRKHIQTTCLMLRLLHTKVTDAQWKHQPTILLQAVALGIYQIVECLIELGFNINVYDDKGRTPLYCAALFENLAIIDLLKARGAIESNTTIERAKPITEALQVWRDSRKDQFQHPFVHPRNIKSEQTELKNDLELKKRLSRRRNAINGPAGYKPITKYEHEIRTIFQTRQQEEYYDKLLALHHLEQSTDRTLLLKDELQEAFEKLAQHEEQRLQTLKAFDGKADQQRKNDSAIIINMERKEQVAIDQKPGIIEISEPRPAQNESEMRSTMVAGREPESRVQNQPPVPKDFHQWRQQHAQKQRQLRIQQSELSAAQQSPSIRRSSAYSQGTATPNLLSEVRQNPLFIHLSQQNNTSSAIQSESPTAAANNDERAIQQPLRSRSINNNETNFEQTFRRILLHRREQDLQQRTQTDPRLHMKPIERPASEWD